MDLKSRSSTQSTFTPKYDQLSARERMLKNIYGSSREHTSENTCENTQLSHNTGPTPSSARKQQSQLIPTTQPWSTPMSRREPPVVTDSLGDSPRSVQTEHLQESFFGNKNYTPTNPRRTVSEFIPSTMPWVVELGQGKATFTEPVRDYRRKKLPVVGNTLREESVERAGTQNILSVDNNTSVTSVCLNVPLVSPVPAVPSVPSSTASTPDLTGDPPCITLYRITNVSSDFSEVSLKRLISNSGVHVAKIKLVTDILRGGTGDCMSFAKLYVRHGGEVESVTKTLRDLLSFHGMRCAAEESAIPSAKQ